MAGKPKPQPCEWTNQLEAFTAFATHKVKTESARHIKPLHWYVACRLVLEGGFHPNNITPRPPFDVVVRRKGGRNRYMLSYDPALGGTGEQVILGGLKTKNVDVVVNLHHVGPVLAVSCKGTTKSFRNLTNRMEETIGECTNLHITYPAMVIGYFALLRANRTAQDAAEAADLDPEDSVSADEEGGNADEGADAAEAAMVEAIEPVAASDVRAARESNAGNNLAIGVEGMPVEGIVRFHAALSEMTGRRGIRDEISRYEAMTMALVEPQGPNPGSVFPDFPEASSGLHLSSFFDTLYRRYEERFVYGAPLLADRGITTRFVWDPESPAFADTRANRLDFEPRLAAAP